MCSAFWTRRALARSTQATGAAGGRCAPARARWRPASRARPGPGLGAPRRHSDPSSASARQGPGPGPGPAGPATPEPSAQRQWQRLRTATAHRTGLPQAAARLQSSASRPRWQTAAILDAKRTRQSERRHLRSSAPQPDLDHHAAVDRAHREADHLERLLSLGPARASRPSAVMAPTRPVAGYLSFEASGGNADAQTGIGQALRRRRPVRRPGTGAGPPVARRGPGRRQRKRCQAQPPQLPARTGLVWTARQSAAVSSANPM